MPPKALWHRLKECRSYSSKQITLLLKILRTKFKFENQQKAIIPKVWCLELLRTALLLNEIYLSMKFKVSSLNTFWVILRTKFKNKNEQREITPKVFSFKLWLLCTALLRNKIYKPIKFHVDALHTLHMLRTKKDGRTDWQTVWRTDVLTDGRVDYCMPPFGCLKTTLFKKSDQHIY